MSNRSDQQHNRPQPKPERTPGDRGEAQEKDKDRVPRPDGGKQLGNDPAKEGPPNESLPEGSAGETEGGAAA